MVTKRGQVYYNKLLKVVNSSMSSIKYLTVLRSGPGIRCLFDPWIREPGWVKNQDPDPG